MIKQPKVEPKYTFATIVPADGWVAGYADSRSATDRVRLEPVALWALVKGDRIRGTGDSVVGLCGDGDVQPAPARAGFLGYWHEPLTNRAWAQAKSRAATYFSVYPANLFDQIDAGQQSDNVEPAAAASTLVDAAASGAH